MYKWSIPLCFNFLHRNLFNVDMVWVDDILNTLGWIAGVDPIGTNRIVIFDESVVCGFNTFCCCCTGNFFSSIMEVDKGILVCGGGDGSFINDACEEEAEEAEDDDSSSSDWTIRDILWWVAVLWLPYSR